MSDPSGVGPRDRDARLSADSPASEQPAVPDVPDVPSVLGAFTQGDSSVLAVMIEAATDARRAVEALSVEQRRAKGPRPGQYILDLHAERAAMEVLDRLELSILSEEAGLIRRGDPSSMLILDPIDGSTNCARRIPYWATTIALVVDHRVRYGVTVNHPAGEIIVAALGAGAWRNGERLSVSDVTDPGRGVVATSGVPLGAVPFRQMRMMGSAALSMVEVASGGIDGFVDTWGAHGIWDYAAGILICEEAGAVVADGEGRDLVVDDPAQRRRPVAAATRELWDSVAALKAY